MLIKLTRRNVQIREMETKPRRLREGAEPWVRFLRRSAIAIEVLCGVGVFFAGIMTEPTWERAAFIALAGTMFWAWNQIHEAANELLGIL